MIDVNFKIIGEPDFGKKLAQADSGIRQSLRDELAIIGEEIVTRAQSSAPKRTGIMASKIIWFFGRRAYRGSKKAGTRTLRVVESASKKNPGKIEFAAMPTGRAAHLVERGVNASFYQRPGNRGRGKIFQPAGALTQAEGPRFKYPRTLRIAARPFFMPAVESVGGAEGVNIRLQGSLDDLARSL